MNKLRKIIKEQLLLEKKIAVLTSKIEVSFKFEVDRSTHAYLRSKRTDIPNYDEREISNSEIKYIIELSMRKIAESIMLGEIKDGVPFVIKSIQKEIAIAIDPTLIGGTYWKLFVLTVFRESEELPFRVSKDQVVIWI